jgi:hypothetical protein
MDKYLLNSEKPFLSSNFTTLKPESLPFAFGLLNLPMSSANSKSQHKFKSDKKRGIFITAGSNVILFKKEIKEGECNIKKDIIITHRYQSLIDAAREDEIEDFLINHPYECEIIMTNVSPKHKQFTLLY